MKEYIWTLIARKLAGEATTKELETLQELLKQDPELDHSLKLFEELWEEGSHWYRWEYTSIAKRN